MWLPFAWIIEHGIGYFFAIMRTMGVVIVWLCFPEHRFEAVSLVFVIVYAISLYVMKLRFRAQTFSANAK